MFRKGKNKMEGDYNDARFWRGKYESLEERLRGKEKENTSWKIAFGWTLTGIILLGLVGFIILASSHTGYTPEQVSDIAIKICKEIR